MAIKVKHGVNAGAVAAAAFGGAQGAARAAAERGGAQAATQLELQGNAIQAQAAQAQAGREHDLARMSFGAELQQQSAEAAQIRGREDLEFGLTTRQKSELSRLADAEAQAMVSSDFTEDEKQELRRMFAAKRGGIQPVQRLREKTPAERFKERTYTDPKTGAVFPIEEDGSFGRPIYQPPERQPTWQDKIKAFQAAAAAAADPDGSIDFGGPRFRQALALMGMGDVDVEAGRGAALESGQSPAAAAPQAPAATEAAATAPGARPGMLGSDPRPLPGGPGVAGVAEFMQGPAVPATLEQQIARITQAPAKTGAWLSVSDMHDLPTVRAQIEMARRRLKDSDEEHRQVVEIMGEKRPGFVDVNYRRDQKAIGERLQQLRERESALREEAESLTAKKLIRDRLREQAEAQTPRAPQRRGPERAAAPVRPAEPAAPLSRKPQPRRFANADLTPEGIERARAAGQRDREAEEARRQAMAEERRRSRERGGK